VRRVELGLVPWKPDEQVDAIIVKRLETTPPGETHWSTRSMAKTAGVSHTMVGRIWRTFRLQPHRTESFTILPDPPLVEKIRDDQLNVGRSAMSGRILFLLFDWCRQCTPLRVSGSGEVTGRQPVQEHKVCRFNVASTSMP
jgi:hypothetical protein